MIDFVWNSIKDKLSKITFPKDKEFGCNICHYIVFYISDKSYGTKYGVEIPNNPMQVGSFHTHVDGEYEFSITDIREAVKNNERYIFIGNEAEVYGIDLSKYNKMIKRYGTKWSKLRKRLNSKLKSFDY